VFFALSSPDQFFFFGNQDGSDNIVDLPPGSTIRMEVFNGQFTVYINGVMQTLVVTAVPTVNLQGGVPGMDLFWNTQASDVQLSHFSAGIITESASSGNIILANLNISST